MSVIRVCRNRHDWEKMMNEMLKEYLLQGKYIEAAEICKAMNQNDIRETMMSIAYDTESICVYSFTQYMIRKTNKEMWIELAIEIMLNPLCFVEGAYSVALFHAREMLLMKRNVENLNRILFFYDIPEKLISKEEAQAIAKEILKMEEQG